MTFTHNPNNLFPENKTDILYEHTLAEVYMAILEQEIRDLVLPDETWKILRKARPAHIERQPEPEY